MSASELFFLLMPVVLAFNACVIAPTVARDRLTIAA